MPNRAKPQNNFDETLSGMLLLDKPSGITSFKAASKIRKTLNVKKTGHCGTLDPLATGLLLILVGKATKLQDKFMKKDKVYRASFLLGVSTDSGDTEGNVVEKKDCSHVTAGDAEKALKGFVGEISQIPPMYSALKYGGKKLYELARKGITVERQPRKVTIKSIEMVSFKDGIAEAVIECSSGTYIRTLAEDFGKALGCGATVCALRREKINGFDVADALKAEDFENADKIKSSLISIEELKMSC
ncbi:MAG: tRNA pseudouridine(55) synthase TruB [Endomicrobia bacterium]|nr:tRNA pseudouridine(55) synthase TruB [Endomicrobiia bacterium]